MPALTNDLLRKMLTMKLTLIKHASLAAAAAVLAACSPMQQKAASGPACDVAGPQTPRDIDSAAGNNPVTFAAAPAATDLNLCNIHFHMNAEHKGKDFALFAGDGDRGGVGGGYQCQMSKTLTAAERAPVAGDVCKGLKPGDTLEVHWVHSSCNVKPGAGLGSCLAPECTDPKLRVETQVFTLVNDTSAPKLQDYDYSGRMVNGRHQANALPTSTGKPVEFLGSTTGPSYTNEVCSPLKVSWSVRPSCAKLDINSVAQWCKSNAFKEDHAHGVRKLVVNPRYLSPIQ